MRVQGALRALTDTMSQATLTVQLDLMKTISKLLLKNERNQSEFLRIKGYSFILQLLDKITDEDSTPYSLVGTRLSLAQCFHIICTIVLDGNSAKLVSNVNALCWVF